MATKTVEIPADWFHLHVGEAKSILELLVVANGSVLVHSFGSDDELTVDAGKMLSVLRRCVCESRDRKDCTCYSSFYQDREGAYHFVTHSLLILMEAQGEANVLAVTEAGDVLEQKIATIIA